MIKEVEGGGIGGGNGGGIDGDSRGGVPFGWLEGLLDSGVLRSNKSRLHSSYQHFSEGKTLSYSRYRTNQQQRS
ncbi:hypothetical protein V1477_010400 [Vespula maculifrons]|uniref:Uncharacterized protein n=1 Tax=Vespula maculifrons TaxID=7453 RepID=A0ABD2C8F8_VESMC